ncbi:unnamed protein product [Gongylonema pulchrum]|uniref:DUF1330 domain-containing protein n=1 Tax=Gongylonema pulchrum TaxID=637853 RepID=A0A183DK30_9BILA|nr:unnamed protein product [Gongylonema pulchrum]
MPYDENASEFCGVLVDPDDFVEFDEKRLQHHGPGEYGRKQYQELNESGGVFAAYPTVGCPYFATVFMKHC